MLKIRLQRIGKRGQAYFKVIVTEHTTKPKGKYLELLGSYDPHKNEINVDAEKIKHWLSQGAQLSPTLNNLLVGRHIIEGEKMKIWTPPKVIAEPKKEEVTTKLEVVNEKPAEEKSETPVESGAQAEVPTAG